MARRARGTGSVRYHAPSGLWRASLPKALDPTERPEYFSTHEEATVWLDGELDRRARLSDGHSGETTVREYSISWIETTATSKSWSIGTTDTQTSHLEYLAPIFERPLDSVKRSDLQALIFALMTASRRVLKYPDGTEYQRPASPAYVHNVVGTWRTMFRTAVRDDLIRKSPAEDLDLPVGYSERAPSWTPSEARQLVPATAGHLYEAVYALIFGCALRIGEARGLAWDDVDEAKARAWINATEYKGQGVQRRVKGRIGKWVPLPAPVLAALARQRERQTWDAAYVAEHAPGVIASYDVIVKHLKRLAAAVGVRVLPPHAGRHAVGNLLGAGQVPLATIADRLRHRGRTVTADWYIESEDVGEELATRLLTELFASDPVRSNR